MGWLHVKQEGKGIYLNTLKLNALNFDRIESIIKDSSILNDFSKNHSRIMKN